LRPGETCPHHAPFRQSLSRHEPAGGLNLFVLGVADVVISVDRMEKTALEEYADARDRFAKTATVTSAVLIVLAGASRVPLWQLSSPVDWLSGSLNVGFLPVFGPIVVFGGACAVFLELKRVVALREAAEHEASEPRTSLASAILTDMQSTPDRRGLIASLGLNLWHFAVPVLAYAILLSSYSEFVRPVEAGVDRPGRYTDLLFGTGGWKGFPGVLPSVRDNLERVAAAQQKGGDTEGAMRTRQLAKDFPWIYPPFQTWAYLAGFVLTIDLMLGAFLLSQPRR